ncbi:sarcosine oxidase subunit gamma [Brevibacterium aurantiacum]|uniref:Sarcosine oxidase subunit gamma n=1 Tax=Brevibacterium aurantiacum TaxID=273384 RepID=A0A4Z0KHE1_BREAU|nr:sarcosine oxidase subunit gamma family protein [Brevibacterium aurantiacum]TGD38116.1 sarcosine oxidase subunit gamma [Brevibacterium aurantiacum]
MADTTQATQQSQTQSSTAQHSFETDAEVLDTLRTSPAAHLGEDMARATELGGQAVGLRERSFAVQLGLRATPGTASAEALESALGITLPGRVGEVTGDEAGLHTLWLSPDEFLTVDVSRRQRPGETLVAEAALEGLPGQAVDLSANRTILELTGVKAREVLEKSVRADLHPRAFGVGQAISTQMGPVPVILHHSAELEYRVYPRASFADFAVRWLLDGMAEFLSNG